MDRQLAYTGALPQDTDILSTNKNMLYGLGYALQAALGTGTCVIGLAGAQSTIPDLHITIGPGAIHALTPVDATAYGDLGTDANTIVKQGLLKAAQTLTLTPPGTTGYSQVYLVEAAYSDTDGGATVLPYYNSSNPSAPYAGPANAGTSNYTVRQGLCTITLKAGTAAATGSQTTPSTDAGYVPLYTITLANGQTAITTAQIVLASGAPFVPFNLNNLKIPISLVPVTSTQTLTFPAGSTRARIKGNGAGGGGGGSFGGGSSGTGGGGAPYIDALISNQVAGNSLAFTIGALGAGGANTPTSGSTGGTTTITAPGATITLTGGAGGASGTSALSSTTAAGGTVSSSGANLTMIESIAGVNGGFGYVTTSGVISGIGGLSPRSGGNAAPNIGGGSPGPVPGAGGSAGSYGGAGGAGAGASFIVEFLP